MTAEVPRGARIASGTGAAICEFLHRTAGLSRSQFAAAGVLRPPREGAA